MASAAVISFKWNKQVSFITLTCNHHSPAIITPTYNDHSHLQSSITCNDHSHLQWSHSPTMITLTYNDHTHLHWSLSPAIITLTCNGRDLNVVPVNVILLRRTCARISPLTSTPPSRHVKQTVFTSQTLHSRTLLWKFPEISAGRFPEIYTDLSKIFWKFTEEILYQNIQFQLTIHHNYYVTMLLSESSPRGFLPGQMNGSVAYKILQEGNLHI